MPNWCCSSYCFYSDTEKGKEQLKDFYEKLEKAIAPNTYRRVNSDFGDGWLGNVIYAICPQYLKFTSQGGITCEYNGTTVSFRGTILDMSFDTDDGALRVTTETAWEPMEELWKMLLEVCDYTDVTYVFQAEEPGCGIYINTDMEGRFFLDAYHVEVFIHDDFYCYETFYPSSEEELLEIENKIIADMRAEYKAHPERYNLPKNFNTRKLRKQRTATAALQVIKSNIFETEDGPGFIDVHEYTA